MKRLNWLSTTGWTALAVFCVAMAFVGFRGPSRGPDLVEGKITLKLWHVPGANPTNVVEAAHRKLYDKFLEDNPDIQIVHGGGLRLPVGGEVPLMMAFAGGLAPDVIYIMQENMHAYIEQGFLYPLDEYIEGWKGAVAIHPDIEKHLRRDGNLFAYPALYQLFGLYYRKDMFRRAGLDPRKPPKTWAQLEEYSQKLTDPTTGQAGFAMPWGHLGAWFFPNFIYQSGGELAAQDADGTWRSTLHEPKSVRAFQWAKEQIHKKWVHPKTGKQVVGVVKPYRNVTDMHRDFQNSKLAMMMYVWSDDAPPTRLFEPRLVARSQLPAGPDGDEAGLLISELYGINSSIKDKAKRDAAWRYIKFMCSETARRIRTEMYVEWGMAPFANPDDLDRFGFGEYMDEFQRNWQKLSGRTWEIGRVQPNTPNFRAVQKVFADTLDACVGDANSDVETILKETSVLLDGRVFSNIPEDEMNRKRNIALGVFLVLVIGGTIAGALAIRAAVRRRAASADIQLDVDPSRRGVGVHLVAWMFMAPALLSILIWNYYPLARGAGMAFEDYYIVKESQWVGLDNFIRVLSSDLFWIAVKNTIYYVALTMGLGFFLPIILAVLLDEVPFGKLTYRVIYYLPAVTSGLVIMFLWKLFYDPSEAGMFNQMLGWLGIGPLKWLDSPNLAMLCVVVPGIWASAGPGCIIYLAALKNVPDELYEAADLDGAGIFSKFWNVTVPNLKALIIINFLGAFIGSFQAMQNIFVMTGGGPQNATHTIGIEIFFDAFLYLRFGYATAIGWILGFVLIGFTLWQLRILKKVEFKAGGRA